MRWTFARFAAPMLCACATHAAQEGPEQVSDTLMSWNAVEVITNDFDTVSRIREAAGAAELSSSKFVCTNLIGPRVRPDGPSTAVYIVEVNVADREPPVYGHWIHVGAAVREYVNDERYLDYDNVELSSYAARLHVATKGREGELAAAVSSCEPSLRMTGFHLMNFVGDPQRFVRLAGAHINDWHLGVANVATRFLTTFADFVPATEMPGLASEACKSLREGGFFARSNSLLLLNAWRKSQELSFDQLSPECQRQVRDIARTSLAEQIALPARELLYPPTR